MHCSLEVLCPQKVVNCYTYLFETLLLLNFLIVVNFRNIAILCYGHIELNQVPLLGHLVCWNPLQNVV